MTDLATPIIFVHGFLDGGEIWRPVTEMLGPKAIKVATPDLAGMGRRTADPGPFTLERYAGEVVGLLDNLGQPAVLIGHSMGSQIVELAAIQRPDHVRALMLLSPIPLAGTKLSAHEASPLAAVGGNAEAQREVRRSFMGASPDPQVLKQLVEIGLPVRRNVSEAVVTAWNNGASAGHSPSAFTGPVWIVAGDQDRFSTAEMVAGVAGRFALATHRGIPGCGHWPHAERPECVADVIEEFLDSLPALQSESRANSLKGWSRAFAEQSAAAFGEVFAPDVEFEASILTRTAKGRELVQTIMGAASKLYQSVEFTHKTTAGDQTYLEWKARMKVGENVAGITVLTTDGFGKISAVAIHHRPLNVLLRFSSELGRALSGKVDADYFFSA